MVALARRGRQVVHGLGLLDQQVLPEALQYNVLQMEKLPQVKQKLLKLVRVN